MDYQIYGHNISKIQAHLLCIMHRALLVSEMCIRTDVHIQLSSLLFATHACSLLKYAIKSCPICYRYKRRKRDPETPDKFVNCSRRSWDGRVKHWKLKLHGWVADYTEISSRYLQMCRFFSMYKMAMVYYIICRYILCTAFHFSKP